MLKPSWPLIFSVSLNVCLIAAWFASSRTSAPSCSSDSPGYGSISAVVKTASNDEVLLHARRMSGDSSSGQASSGSGGHDGPHKHDALLFLFNALVIGTAVMHLATYYKSLQQTVVLFVLGMIYSFFYEGLDLKKESGVFGYSYDMWMAIDPHLLMFTLLPALLAGDAMTIDTSVAKRVANQCMYLAGPGVLISAMTVTGFLMWFLDWPFLLSLVTSSILCATDPVAVVALLKELGASPVLTVQIQGESLLNDGTAIVLYLVAYDYLKGEDYDAADIVMFLVKKALMAVALGTFIGYFFFTWIRAAGNKFKHESSMIQISLTLCCAYWSFIIAEGVFHMSGVLATVASSLVLAHHMWPHIVSPDSLHHVWHAVESLGNIIIFFLAGAVTGMTMVDIDFINYLRLIVIYIVLTLVRGGLLFASRPLLRRLGTDKSPISVADTIVMTWGGLRGAVGLALAIWVQNERAADKNGVPQISKENADLVVFFVSGVAFLTTTVNATTAPFLVRYLGITELPAEQLRLLRMIYEQLMCTAQDKSHPTEVAQSLKKMLADVKHHIDHHKKSEKSRDLQNQRSSASVVPVVSGSLHRASHNLGSIGNMINQKTGLQNLGSFDGIEDAEDNADLVEKLRLAEKLHKQLPRQTLNLLGELPESLLGQVDGMCDLLLESGVDVRMAKVVNRSFLSLVSQNYWKQIDKGFLRPGSAEADTVFTSVRMAMSPIRIDLDDFDFILASLDHGRMVEGVEDWWKVFPDESSSLQVESLASDKCARFNSNGSSGSGSRFNSGSDVTRSGDLSLLMKCIHSPFFNVGISLVIIINAIYVAIEEAVREDDDNSTVWLILECVFTFIFTVEFAVKFVTMRFNYFRDSKNVFDFCLVLLGLVGIAMSASEGSTTVGSSEARLLRMARVFRVLRFLRVFRLFHARLSKDKDIRPQVGLHLHRILTLTSFVHAQLHAQMSLVRYFGVNGEIDEPDECEIARCILQSQVAVYRAIGLCVKEESSMDGRMLQEIQWVHHKRTVIESLEEVVMSAWSDGAISAKEAESILHPLHIEITACLNALHDLTDGIKASSFLHSLNFESAAKTMQTNGSSPVSKSDSIIRIQSPEQDMDKVFSTPKKDPVQEKKNPVISSTDGAPSSSDAVKERDVEDMLVAEDVS